MMATFAILRQPVTILVTDYTNPNNLTNDSLILNSLIINKSLVLRWTIRRLMGITWENSTLDPLAVLHLDNQLYVHIVTLYMCNEGHQIKKKSKNDISKCWTVQILYRQFKRRMQLATNDLTASIANPCPRTYTLV